MEELQELLDRKEDFEDSLKESSYKLKELNKELLESSSEVKRVFKTTDSKKLKLIAKELNKELEEVLTELEDNEIYLDIIG